MKKLDKEAEDYSEQASILFDDFMASIPFATTKKATIYELFKHACNGNFQDKIFHFLYNTDKEMFLKMFKNDENEDQNNEKILDYQGFLKSAYEKKAKKA